MINTCASSANSGSQHSSYMMYLFETNMSLLKLIHSSGIDQQRAPTKKNINFEYQVLTAVLHSCRHSIRVETSVFQEGHRNASYRRTANTIKGRDRIPKHQGPGVVVSYINTYNGLIICTYMHTCCCSHIRVTWWQISPLATRSFMFPKLKFRTRYKIPTCIPTSNIRLNATIVEYPI